MKKIITTVKIVIALLCLFHLSAWCQPGNDKLKDVVSKLKTFSTNHIIEKAYLHFDKPYYAAGDTIYFKAYLTAGERHLLSNLSGVLYADLINTNNKIDKSIKLQVINGVAWGDFALPDSLPKGNYRVRAYTNWMRNDGDGNYFDQTFMVGSSLDSKVPEAGTPHINSVNARPDLQFFPEGGSLVTGISSKIAFKAIGPNGLGIDVGGIVEDSEGNEITKFTTAHLGMGYFYLKPETGKTYRAKITYADGEQDVVNIPQAASSGIVLKINNDSLDKAPLQIIANENYFAENHDSAISLLVYSGGIATMITTKLDSLVINLAILKRHLHSGITKVTLFSSAGEPLSERLIFIQNYDQLNLSVNTDKTVYSKREKVQVGINALNRADSAATGHFSVSVIDESKVQVDENSENTIYNYLLLTSELKGYIEQPNYYFANITDKTKADLDLVMLTHGYRRFEWKQLLNNAYPPVAYQPESTLEITGIAESLGGKPLVNATVSLITMHGGQFQSAHTDDKGRFRFSDLVFSDTAKFVLQAVDAKGGNYTKLVYDKERPEPVVTSEASFQKDTVVQLMSAYMENNKKHQDEIAQYGGIKGKMLKTVIINGKKPEENPHHNLVSPQFADQIIHPDEMAKGGPFSVRIEGLLHGAHIVTGGAPGSGAHAYLSGSRVPMMVILDGSKTDGDLNELTGLDVESVEVLKTLAATAIYNAPYGVLIINTRSGLQAEDVASIGVLPISPKGFYIAREFYSPKYDQTNLTNNRPDLRSTIFWKPELVTDKDGNASFEYYNADGTGSYRIVVEGIDDKGNIGRQVYRYKVE